MRVLELTMTGAAVQITPNTDGIANQGQPIYVTTLLIQPATAPATLGDNNVTATRGIVYPTSNVTPLIFNNVRGSLLSQYYLFGTNGDKVEVFYETSQ